MGESKFGEGGKVVDVGEMRKRRQKRIMMNVEDR